jgi:tetratricopeptide (TPR) repeat protein
MSIENFHNDYDDVLNRSEQVYSLFLAEGRPTEQIPLAAIAELEALTLGSGGSAGGIRGLIPFLVKWLIARSHHARFGPPEKTLYWAHLACLAADSCSPATAGSAVRWRDLQGRAWSQFGNALRIAGRYVEAQQAFDAAERYLAAGTGDLELRGDLLAKAGSLFIQRTDSALESLRAAEKIYADLGELQKVASVWVSKSVIYAEVGEPDRMQHLLRKALRKIDPEQDPLLLVSARHNLVQSYRLSGQPQAALALFERGRKFMEHVRLNLLVHLRGLWQEGRLRLDLGEHEAAENALLRAHIGFSDLGLAEEAALVALDLSEIQMMQTSSKSLRKTLKEILPLFQKIGRRREALMALQRLQKMREAPVRDSRTGYGREVAV